MAGIDKVCFGSRNSDDHGDALKCFLRDTAGSVLLVVVVDSHADKRMDSSLRPVGNPTMLTNGWHSDQRYADTEFWRSLTCHMMSQNNSVLTARIHSTVDCPSVPATFSDALNAA